MRKAFIVSAFLFFFAVSSAGAQATLFSVASIGTVDTSDGVLSSYTYTSENPEISGTAEELEDVIVSVDGVDETVTADSLGIWVYEPTELLDGGIYEIVITSGTDSESFTLTIDETSIGGTTGTEEDVESKGGDTLPDTGIGDYTYILVFGSIAIFGSALVLAKMAR